MDNQENKDKIVKYFNKAIAEQIKHMIPVIMLTGTTVDETNKILKKREKNLKSDLINISNILGFDIFPSLMVMFCLT